MRKSVRHKSILVNKMEFIFFMPLILLCAAEYDETADKTKRILLEDNSLEEEVASFKSQISEIIELRNTAARQNSIIYELQQQVAALKSSQAWHSQETVAFMVCLTKTVTGTHHRIFFDDVKLNLGNGYNPSHGIFVVPVDGTYQFTVTACSHLGHYTVLELTVNSSNLGKVLAGDADYDECTSKVFLAQLRTGDDVFVQHVNQGDNLYAAQVNGLPSFSGILLQAK